MLFALVAGSLADTVGRKIFMTIPFIGKTKFLPVLLSRYLFSSAPGSQLPLKKSLAPAPGSNLYNFLLSPGSRFKGFNWHLFPLNRFSSGPGSLSIFLQDLAPYKKNRLSAPWLPAPTPQHLFLHTAFLTVEPNTMLNDHKKIGKKKFVELRY